MKTATNLQKPPLENNLRTKNKSLRTGIRATGSCSLRGFSLVEVVLAIGLTTFALLVMFSLMPVGLNTLQDANRQIVEAEVFNILGSELTTTKFTELDAYAASATSFPRYFDNEGLLLTTPADIAAKKVFTAQCRILDKDTDQIRRAIICVGYRITDAKLNELMDKAIYKDPAIKSRAYLLCERGL